VPVIKGDVTAKGFEQWIEVSTFQFSTVRPQSSSEAGNQTAPKRMSEIVISKVTDSASRLLMHEALTNALGSLKVEFDFVKSGGINNVYMKVILEEVLISAVSFGSKGSDHSTENIVLDYTKISYDYKKDSEDLPPPARSSGVHAGWNTRHN